MELYDTSPQIDSLLTAMKREARKSRMFQKVRIGVVCLFLSTYIAYVIFEFAPHFHAYALYWILFYSGINYLFKCYTGRVNTENRRKLVQQLANIEDKQACGAMSDVLGFEDVELKKIAREALKILLPRLQSTDADLLNTTQRQHLHGVLKQQDTENNRIRN